MLKLSLSTMWTKGRFNHMKDFASKARQLGFTCVEANTLVSPQMLHELVEAAIPISSIHSPCPTAISSRGTPAASLSLSSVDKEERTEAIDFAKKTINLASEVQAEAVVLHMGEVPIDLNLQDRLYQLYNKGRAQTKEYAQVREELVCQRAGWRGPYLEAAKQSLAELSEYSLKKGIMLGLETRFHFDEIPNIDEMAELLEEAKGSLTGYWHDVGHAEMQQKLGFAQHENWLSRFHDKMIGIHLHDIVGISDHHVPGKGEADWDMIARHLLQKAIRVCEIGEWNEEEAIKGAVEFLLAKGVAG